MPQYAVCTWNKSYIWQHMYVVPIKLSKTTHKHFTDLLLCELMTLCESSCAHGGDFGNVLPSSLTAS